MQRFEAMTTAEKEAVIRRTRDVTSRREMQALVNSLLQQSAVLSASLQGGASALPCKHYGTFRRFRYPARLGRRMVRTISFSVSS